MNARDFALAQMGHGPCTVGMLTGTLLQHGRGYPEADRQAKEALAALVIEKRAEVILVQGTDVYRYTAKTPMEKS